MSGLPSIASKLAVVAAAGMLAVLAPGAALAQNPTQGSLQGNADLGRLFHTPQQRAELDKRRVSNVAAVQEEAPAVREVLVTVNGYVGRSSGKTTTWINGVPQYDSVRTSDPSRLPLEAADGRKSVKVGATLDTNRGDVRDVIGDGQISINTKAPSR